MKWIDIQAGAWRVEKCSACGKLSDYKFKYCPHCGERMEDFAHDDDSNVNEECKAKSRHISTRIISVIRGKR